MQATREFPEGLSQREDLAEVLSDLAGHPQAKRLLDAFVKQRPHLEGVTGELLKAYGVLAACFEARGALFLCGNGGSFSDALHVSGELMKSFERRRDLSPEQKARFDPWPEGRELAAHLEQGFPVRVLGTNGALASAVQNDSAMRDIHYAQELFACARPGDVLMGISTSGGAANVCLAAITARALGLTTIALTGEHGGRLAALADIPIRAPGGTTRSIQENHQPIYHVLCAMLEVRFFPDRR